MENMAVADIRDGYGVTVVDPKGDLVDSILDSVPRERLDDVVLFDVTDTARPVGFNVLAGENPYMVMGQLIAMFAKLHDDLSNNAPRAFDVLRSTLLTLATAGLTLCEVPVILEPGPRGRAFRDKVVPMLTDRELQRHWRWFDNLSAGEQSEVGAPIMRRLRPLLLRLGPFENRAREGALVS